MTDTLGTSVRVVAGDQLSLCAADPSLHKVVCSREVLARLAGLSATALAPEAERVTNDVGVAALKVLATCVRHSREARVFFSEVARASPADVEQPYGRSSPVLPLVFHPRAAVREHLAVFCAYVVFGKVADLATTHAGLGLVPDPTAMHVPASIARQLRFPVPIRPMDAAALHRARLAASRASSPLEAEGTDRARVRAMLAQRREVRRLGGAAGVLATVERMMHEAGGDARTVGPVARSPTQRFAGRPQRRPRWCPSRGWRRRGRTTTPPPRARPSAASSPLARLAPTRFAATRRNRRQAASHTRPLVARGRQAVGVARVDPRAGRCASRPPRRRSTASSGSPRRSNARRCPPSAPSVGATSGSRPVSSLGDVSTQTRNPSFLLTPFFRPRFFKPEERGEMSAASSAAAKAACELAARVLDAAVALSSAATYGGFVDRVLPGGAPRRRRRRRRSPGWSCARRTCARRSPRRSLRTRGASTARASPRSSASRAAPGLARSRRRRQRKTRIVLWTTSRTSSSSPCSPTAAPRASARTPRARRAILGADGRAETNRGGDGWDGWLAVGRAGGRRRRSLGRDVRSGARYRLVQGVGVHGRHVLARAAGAGPARQPQGERVETAVPRLFARREVHVRAVGDDVARRSAAGARVALTLPRRRRFEPRRASSWRRACPPPPRRTR